MDVSREIYETPAGTTAEESTEEPPSEEASERLLQDDMGTVKSPFGKGESDD